MKIVYMKFSKGDHVRVVRLNPSDDDPRWVGQEGVVIRVASSESYRVIFYDGRESVDINAVKTAFLLEDEAEIYRLGKEAEIFLETELELIS